MISQDPQICSTSIVLGPNYMKEKVYQLCPPEVTHTKISESLSLLSLNSLKFALHVGLDAGYHVSKARYSATR